MTSASVTKSIQTLPPASEFGRVAVLMGGWSSERAVSLKSGAAVHQALLARGVDAVAIDVQRETIIEQLQSGSFDSAFIILHGPGGEDGVIQGVLEVLGIPYTGSHVAASAIAMDKFRTKLLLTASNLPTPKYRVLDDDTDLNDVMAELGLPLMVKPALEGSSIGMTRVEQEADMAAAYALAAKYDGAVIAEQWIHGSEYTIAILGDEALPVIRLETPHVFYDYDAKYVSDDTQYHCPCGLDASTESQIQRIALSAFRAVGLSGWGRVDILCDERHQPYIIELNTIPGMTDHSLVPMAARAVGIDFEELVYRILCQARAGAQPEKNHEDEHVSA